MGLATSNDSDLVFGENEGIENVLASTAREGKEEEGVGDTGRGVEEHVPDSNVLVRDPGEGFWPSFTGAEYGDSDDDLGGGWDSAVSHAS